MKNGHQLDEPSPFAHLAELGNEPTSPEILALDADRRRVEAIIATGALDAYSVDERIRLAWGILRQTDETRN